MARWFHLEFAPILGSASIAELESLEFALKGVALQKEIAPTCPSGSPHDHAVFLCQSVHGQICDHLNTRSNDWQLRYNIDDLCRAIGVPDGFLPSAQERYEVVRSLEKSSA